MTKAWPQLDEQALSIVRQAIADHGSIKAVADKLGISRPSLSFAVSGKYPGDTKYIHARIMDVFSDLVMCPALGIDISPAKCRFYRERPLTTGNPQAIRHFKACRMCRENPHRNIDGDSHDI